METLHNPDQYKQAEQLIEKLLSPAPTVIGIEGGPCGGKTTLVEKIIAEAGEKPVISVAEAASEHILELANQGVNFSELEHDNRSLYLETEAKILGSIVNNIDAAVAANQGTNAIILADRCDIAAYVEPDEYASILARIGLTHSPIYSQIDQMYYLPSVARINEHLYDQLKATNPARFETAQRAAEICIRNLEAVADHPELYVNWGEDFANTITKMTRSALRPETESEVKLAPMTTEAMESFIDASEQLSTHQIRQTYHSAENHDFRLRETVTESGLVLHYFTVKTGNGVTRSELQHCINESEYDLLKTIPMIGAPLLKQRQHVLAALPQDRKRSWSIDRYYDRRLSEWNIETDVVDVTEAFEIEAKMNDFKRVESSAQYLSMILGRQAILR